MDIITVGIGRALEWHWRHRGALVVHGGRGAAPKYRLETVGIVTK